MDQKVLHLPTHPNADWAEDDLEQLYRRHAPWLNDRLRRRFGPAVEADADDLVHDAYARLRSGGGVREPRALLMRIAANLAKDLLRRRAVRRRHVAEAMASPVARVDTLNACDALAAKELILSLPEALQEFAEEAGDDVARLDTAAYLSSYRAMFKDLTEKARSERERSDAWIARNAARLGLSTRTEGDAD